MSLNLSIQLDNRDQWIIIRLNGVLDAITLHRLEKTIKMLIEEKKIDILVDCSKLSSISSSALRYLLALTQKITQLEGNFILFSLKEKVKELIKLAEFDNLLKIAESENQALQMRKES